MHIEKFNYNDTDDLISNAYVVDDGKFCFVIDPGANNDSIINYIKKHSLVLKAVLLTHGHIDHIRGVDRLVEKHGCELYVHQFDDVMLKDPYINCSINLGERVTVKSNPIFVKDGDILKILDDCEIKVIHTPYHTRGSVCYYFNNNILFTGDTLFRFSVGRDDLPNASPNSKTESFNKIKKLPPETKIYPGHGQNSVLSDELALNRFLYY